ncbi:MAG: hypothetical protein Q8L48_18485 [Archangium sp.]|nr:hypothetical protein [Archangium sp.]
MATLLLLLLLTGSPEDELSLGPVLSRVSRGPVTYLALESGGVAVVDTSGATPRLVGRLAEGRTFSQLVLSGDALLALELRQEVTTFSLAEPLAPIVARPGVQAVVTAPAAPPPGPTPRAKVTAVTDGRVLFDGGTGMGFVKGSRLRVISQRPEMKPDLVTGQQVSAPSGAITAVLEVEDAQPGRAMAMLGRGDTAEVGDLVEPTSAELSERLLAPRRAPFRFRTGFEVRPFLGLEGQSKPVGVMLDAYLQWYLHPIPVVLSLSGAPLSVAFNSREAHYPGVIAFTAAYATDFFEIGLGIGALYGNPGPCEPFLACEVNTGFTINQVLRLGAIDGLNLEWHSSIFSRPNQFVFGVGRGVIAVPLNSRLSLFGAGGGGENGWAMGEFGVRTAVGGAGGKGTIILSASLGVSGIFDGPSRELVLGPAVSFGAEWRL